MKSRREEPWRGVPTPGPVDLDAEPVLQRTSALPPSPAITPAAFNSSKFSRARMLFDLSTGPYLVARLVEQVGVAMPLFVETGLLAQHGPGQPINLVIRRAGGGHQICGDGEGRGCLEVAG